MHSSDARSDLSLEFAAGDVVALVADGARFPILDIHVQRSDFIRGVPVGEEPLPIHAGLGLSRARFQLWHLMLDADPEIYRLVELAVLVDLLIVRFLCAASAKCLPYPRRVAVRSRRICSSGPLSPGALSA